MKEVVLPYKDFCLLTLGYEKASISLHDLNVLVRIQVPRFLRCAFVFIRLDTQRMLPICSIVRVAL